MRRMLINATQPDELRVAITYETLLFDLDIEHPGQEQKKSNIYKARISSIEPSLGAVFVDYGAERHGFLPLKEISREYFLTEVENLENIDIRKVLKEGQELVIQVEKEERGTKGAALTTFISLAGSYLVLMPNNPRAGGVSRRIEGDERDQLKDSISQLDLPEGMGVIIRTAGVGKKTDELKWDLSVLLRYWEAIKQAAVAKPGPYLIHQESDVIIRAIRDYLRPDIEEIIVDEPKAYEKALRYLSQVRPDFMSRIKLYTDQLPLFSRFQIEQQIENAYRREVHLPSGGSIVIDITEALISIDVNSARATKGGNIEETAYQTNLEAAEEIARQLRIRDIGGLVVIDFIDMTPSRNQRDVENRLREALRFDRARIQIGRISRFGLLEMSRQRLRASLSKSTQVNCPTCDGRGTVRGVESMALSIIHLIQEQASRTRDVALQVQLPVDIATYLLNEKRELLRQIESHANLSIVVIPNPHLQSPQYQLREVKDDSNRAITPSYKLTQIPKIDTQPKKPGSTRKPSEPVVNEFLSSTNVQPANKKSSSNGLIKRLWDIIFGAEAATERKKTPTRKTNLQANTSTRQRVPQRGQSAGGSRQRPPSQNRNRPPRKTGDSTEQSRARRGTRGGTQTRPPKTPQQSNRPPRTTQKPASETSSPTPTTPPTEVKATRKRKTDATPDAPESSVAHTPATAPTAPKNPSTEHIPTKTAAAPKVPASKTPATESKTPAVPKTSVTITPKPVASPPADYKGFGKTNDQQLEQVKTKKEE